MRLSVAALFLLALPGRAHPTESKGPDEFFSRARLSALAQDPQWLALLHYKNGRSSVRGAFFLSSDGSRDPEAEMEATLRAFSREPSMQCRFPARYAWLKARLSFAPSLPPQQGCARFSAWLEALDADGVTLIYADAFLNHAASMYGHTFLLIRRRGSAPQGRWLDYTINFSAVPDARGLRYVWKGLTGRFPGRYSVVPYYLKIREYENDEGRDLWEYDLALSTEATARLLRHVWELEGATVDYEFFSENCSYQILALLDAADPSLRLAENFRAAVVPADALRAVLSKPGLVVARRRQGPPSTLTEVSPPETGHRTSRWGVGAGTGSRGGFQELSWRGALHDQLAPEEGYLPGSRLEMGALDLRWDDRERRPYLQRLALVDVESLVQVNGGSGPSWSFSMDVDQAEELARAPEASMVYDLRAGAGTSIRADILFGRPWLYALGESAFDAGPVLPWGWRLGAGGRAGISWRSASRWRALIEASYLAFPGEQSPSQERLRLGQSWSIARDVEARLWIERRVPMSEISAQILFYY